MASNALAAMIGQTNPIGDALDSLRREQIAGAQFERQNKLLDLQEKRLAATDSRERQALALKTLPIAARLLSTVTDQASYDRARAQAQGAGIDTSSLPAVYDKATVDQWRSSVAALMDPKDRFQFSDGVAYDVTGATPVPVAGSRKPINVAPGGVVLDPVTNKPIFTAPDRAQAPVAIPDDKSPTGFRYVTREEALGQPALGPSGMSVDFDPTTGKVSGIRSGPGAAKGTGSPLPNSAQGKAIDAIQEGQQTIDRLDYVKSLYEPEFLTYGGKGSAMLGDFLNKLDPEKRSQFTARMRTFQSQTQQYFLAYKKWATGAAAGEKEMAQIEQSIPNPDDSPQAFEAKLEATKQMTRKILVRNQIALKEGVQPGTTAYKDWAQAHPLEGIPSLQERGDQLAAQGYKPEQVVQILKQEGYR